MDADLMMSMRNARRGHRTAWGNSTRLYRVEFTDHNGFESFVNVPADCCAAAVNGVVGKWGHLMDITKGCTAQVIA